MVTWLRRLRSWPQSRRGVPEYDWTGGPAASFEGGSSAYLSTPAPELDQALFDGDHLKGNVHSFVINKLVSFLKSEGYKQPMKWLHIWIAGSSISYQWGEASGIGDLDVLFGVDISQFAVDNPEYATLGDAALASQLNAELHEKLWPLTEHTELNGRTFEATFFMNPGMGTDITTIHPYAAYDVTNDRWTVRPVELPQDPATMYPKHWFKRAEYDRQSADGYVQAYNQSSRDFSAATSGTPGWHNAGARLNLVAAQAGTLFDDIHHGRREAFQGAGHGYADWHNFRWQMANKNGTVKALKTITDAGKEARDATETRLYGAPLEGADELIRRAASRSWEHG